MTYPCKSHYIMLRPIGLELARRGHNVTVITPFKETDPPPNYHQVTIDDKTAWNTTDGNRPKRLTTVDMTTATLMWKFFWIGSTALTEIYLKARTVQEFLAENHQFDLVISEQFDQEAFYLLAYKYKTPLVLVTTFGNCMTHNIVTRNPLRMATVLFEWAHVDEPTSFSGRMKNLCLSLYQYYWWRFWHLEQQKQLAHKYILNVTEPVPSLYELQRDASLFLVNGHFSFDPPTAYLPNVVEIGGAHLYYVDTVLPNDIKNILDEAKHGVVYVSFGSNVWSSELPDDKKNAFLQVFGRLKQTVLWKWEDDTLANKPENIVTRQWFPQKGILAHPNVKVFISHGGLIGTLEAMYNAVPIIGIPLYGDQHNNLLLSQDKGFGKILRYHDINEANLERILLHVLNDDSYKNNAREASIRFRDRAMNALDTAVFWIEYVIRNKGADFMKNPARELSWIAYNMLDVYAFIVLVVLMFVYVIVKILKHLSSLFSAKIIVKRGKEKHH